jgi:hypothetical protein
MTANPIYQFFDAPLNAAFDRQLEIGDCVIVDFGNGQKIAYMTEGSIANCTSDAEFSEVSNQILRIVQRHTNKSLTVSTNYQLNGTYNVTVRAFTWYTGRPNVSGSLTVDVISPPCTMPFVQIIGISTNSWNPTIFNKMQRFQLEGGVQSTCADPTNITKAWTMANAGTNNALTSGRGITVTSTIVDFASGTLDIGSYTICFQCAMSCTRCLFPFCLVKMSSFSKRR